MYKASEKYAEKIVSDKRNFLVRITFGSSTVLTGTTIQNITLDEIVNSGDSLTMGCACSNKVTVNLIGPPTDIVYNDASFTVDVALLIEERPITYEWIPLGKFYGTESETSNDFKNLKLTAYDGFCKMNGKYNGAVGEDTTLQAVYDDLKTQLLSECGITLKSATLPEYTLTFPYLDITFKQAIGYVAGCLGGFARFDRLGELEICWYQDSTYEIPRRMQYMGGFKRATDKVITITSISTGSQDKPIVKGEGNNGANISFENPYITDSMAEAVFTSVNQLSYTPCEVKWRGDPAVQAGDIVTVFDKNDIAHNVLVMSQSVKIGGGCNATILCSGTSATTSEFSSGFESVGQKINRVYTTLEKAILDATNAITGNSGGYVVLNDTNADGRPDEILVLDMEEIPLATKVWRWNKEGLGYAENPTGNAYNGPYETAITADGQINANMITTGALNAELIRVGDEMFGDWIKLQDGVMIFGSADDLMSLRLGNITENGVKTQQVALYSGETRIAYFSSNSFEIENITNGKIRFQNFGFIPRTSGNLSFTKLI